MLRDSGKRKIDWTVVRTDKKQLLTSIGSIEFEKTMFKNRQTGERAYLLDRILGLESHERMTEDAQARMLEEAVQTSYRRAGEETSLLGQVSKETVKNKLHELEFPPDPVPLKKKVVDYLYIDADEDHVSLQFQKEKGDLVMGENHRKNNGVLVKLVYIYEGVEPGSPRSKRHRLVNPYYISGVYDGKDNGKLWDKVYRYLSEHYDLEQVKKVYLNADGGAWIKAGKAKIAGAVSVLDEFHLRKYVIKMTAHMKDSQEDAQKEVYGTIRKGTKTDFRELVERLYAWAETEQSRKKIADSADYILSNWTAAKIRLEKREEVKGCSAEGHVSHVLSSRLSSRPMGWSRHGVHQMAQLRAYERNGREMLELVQYQKKEHPVEEKTENDVLSCKDILNWEEKHRNRMGKYVDSIRHDISGTAKKYAWFNAHIWGL